MHPRREGIICALVAYLLWGVLPGYWKQLQQLGALEILAHRIIWSLVLLLGLVTFRREWPTIRLVWRDARALWLYGVAAVLLAANWGTYIWAVNAGQIVETSLGYFINPLLSVLLGVAFVRERLRGAQWIAIGLAAAGVAHLTVYYGRVPWLALVLATTFGLYGLAKKLAPLGAIAGLALETAALAPMALTYLVSLAARDQSAFGHSGFRITGLLVVAGVVTSLPLLLFAHAARRIQLSTLGLLQYASPSCALLLGVWVYHEPFPPGRALGFVFIWVALGLYWFEGRLRSQRPSSEQVVR